MISSADFSQPSRPTTATREPIVLRRSSPVAWPLLRKFKQSIFFVGRRCLLPSYIVKRVRDLLSGEFNGAYAMPLIKVAIQLRSGPTSRPRLSPREQNSCTLLPVFIGTIRLGIIIESQAATAEVCGDAPGNRFWGLTSRQPRHATYITQPRKYAYYISLLRSE